MIICDMDFANAVLSMVTRFHNEETTYFLQPYKNGSECGWSLYNYDHYKKVCFAENRTSSGDIIVVYFGTMQDFSLQGNVPNDATYKNAKYFKHKQIVKASSFIIKYFEE